MALPNSIDQTTPAATDLISNGDDQIRALKRFIIEVFGLPESPTEVTVGETRDGAGYVGINDAANANMTIGLSIDQSTNDDEALAIGSTTDVTHGVTTIAETQVYASFKKHTGTEGGLLLTGISGGEEGVTIRGIGTAEVTDPPTTATTANINLNAAIINGTGITDAAATANIFQVQNNGTNEFVVKGDGELYSNQSATVLTFDDYNDAVMCADLSYNISGEYSKIMQYNRDEFERIGLMSSDGMVSLTKVQMLQLGAINQLYRQIRQVESKLAQLEA